MTSSLLAVQVDPVAALHLKVALAEHRRVARTNGHTVPPALLALEQAAHAAASPPGADGNRQEPPKGGEAAEPGPTVEPMTRTVRETARILDVSARSVERRVQRGEIRSVKIGRSRRIPLDAIDELLGTHDSTGGQR